MRIYDAKSLRDDETTARELCQPSKLPSSFPVTEVARTRLREEGTKYRTFWQTLHTVCAEEGVKGLYRGLGTQLIRQIPNTAIIMATYEAVVYVLTRHFRPVSCSAGSTSTQFYGEAKTKRELA